MIVQTLIRRGRKLLPIVALALGAAALTQGCDTTYGFQPLSVGSDQARDPQPRSNSQFLRAVYADLLGRNLETYDFQVLDEQGNLINEFELGESQILLAAMDSVGDERVMRSLIVTGLVHSSEVGLPSKADVADPYAFIGAQFRTLLGREPSAYELNAFAAEWAGSDSVGPHEVISAILGSREYQSF